MHIGKLGNCSFWISANMDNYGQSTNKLWKSLRRILEKNSLSTWHQQRCDSLLQVFHCALMSWHPSHILPIGTAFKQLLVMLVEGFCHTAQRFLDPRRSEANAITIRICDSAWWSRCWSLVLSSLERKQSPRTFTRSWLLRVTWQEDSACLQLGPWWTYGNCMQLWSSAMSAPWCTNRVAKKHVPFFISHSARSAESDVRLAFGPEAPEAANLHDAPTAIAMRSGVPGNAMRLWWFGRFDEETHWGWLVRASADIA